VVLHSFDQLLVLAIPVAHLHAAGVPDGWMGDVALPANLIAAC
jgi:hypothetical protein